jgi:hypothetical protein
VFYLNYSTKVVILWYQLLFTETVSYNWALGSTHKPLQRTKTIVHTQVATLIGTVNACELVVLGALTIEHFQGARVQTPPS